MRQHPWRDYPRAGSAAAVAILCAYYHGWGIPVRHAALQGDCDSRTSWVLVSNTLLSRRDRVALPASVHAACVEALADLCAAVAAGATLVRLVRRMHHLSPQVTPLPVVAPCHHPSSSSSATPVSVSLLPSRGHCQSCGQLTPLLCDRCGDEWYCSSECQHYDRIAHHHRTRGACGEDSAD